MSYMLLIVEPVGQRAERTPEQGRAVYDRMLGFAADLQRRGKLLAVESLAASGTRVARRDGARVRIDGPFAEAKEMIGGFFLLDCDDPGEALAIANECPAAEWCTVEVRRTAPCYEV